ncbi:ATPase domain-containing protein [Tunturiibacter psychrotolerans]|jgi:recombination protein RecA|uniref:ATPase domain-containing protein n=1 Tax=Tunturiibacter psychrotolerans TaxID=3069686 RepID=UPI003D1B74ED
MQTAAALRLQIETALAHRIPSSLSPAPRIIRPLAPTGISAVDDLLQGGLPVGAITEIVGSECSGRTSFALSFTAQITQTGKVCAWIDVSDALSPESASATGIDLNRLLWVRCGVTNPITRPYSQIGFSLPSKYLIAPPVKKGLHGGGFGPHPRGEVKGLSTAVSGLLRSEAIAPRCAEPQRRPKVEKEIFEPNPPHSTRSIQKTITPRKLWFKPWSKIDQALRVTDLLLQAGGFSAIVLDLGSIAPEFASRIPLATWFRYRAAAERSQASILLLTQYACAKSSAGLVLRLQPAIALQDEHTVFTGIEHRVEVARERFTPTNVVPMRKQPQSARSASWHSRTAWAGQR